MPKGKKTVKKAKGTKYYFAYFANGGWFEGQLTTYDRAVKDATNIAKDSAYDGETAKVGVFVALKVAEVEVGLKTTVTKVG